MKSPLKKSIGEVVTDYGARVMKVFKKGLLQRSLFDFYGDVKADKLRVKESSSVPATPIDGDGGVMYTKSADGKLYYKSNEISEVELSSQGTNTTYSVSCVDGDNSDEEKIRLTGSDSSTDDVVLEAGTGLSIARDGDKITFTNTVTDTDTVLTTEQVQDISGSLVATGGTKTGITVTYDDNNNNMDFVVDDLHNVGVDGSANQLITDDGDGTVTSESGLTYDSSTDTLQLNSTTTGFPRIEIKSNADSNFGQRLTFIKDRGATPSDGDTLGIVRFEGEDSAQNATFYAQIAGQIAETTDGQEGGKLLFQIASHDGESVTGLEVFDGDAEDEVDVSIASGASSRTTVSGVLMVNGNDITNNTSAANFNISSSRILNLQHAGVYDIQMGNSTNVDVLKVQGDSQEVTVNGTLKLPDNAIVGKQREVFFQNFFDDLGTTKHYLPFKDINEQTTIYQEEAAVVMPCDGRIVSITLRVNFPNADGDITMAIHTRPVNLSVFTTADWVEEETETMSLQNADDSHVFHFAFDNAKHFESSELVSISMQCSADISTNSYWYVSTVVEYDWSTFLGTTSAEISSTP